MSRGIMLVVLGAGVAFWSWFGLPPFAAPAFTRGSDYSGTSFSLLLVVLGVVVIVWGIAVVVAASRSHHPSP